MIKQRYEKGVYLIPEAVPYAEAIREFIVSQSFRRCETATLHSHRGRKRSALYTFHFPPADRWLVMKVARTTGDYPLSRRIELYLKSHLNDYSKAAFNGALALQQAGVATARAVAYWTFRASCFRRESYFLYEKIEADCTARDYRNRVLKSGTSEGRLAVDALMEKILQVIRHLHAQCLRHNDIHTENFLVSVDGKMQDEKAQLRIYLIDTDRVTRARIKIPLIKRFFDLRNLCKLDLCEEERMRFLKRHLGDDYSSAWWRVLTFWRNGGFKPSVWLKRRKERSSSVSGV